MSTAKKFLINYFSKLKESDFTAKNDKFLAAFYLDFTKENLRRDKTKEAHADLFEYYIGYLMRNKSTEADSERSVEILNNMMQKIFQDLRDAILNPNYPDEEAPDSTQPITAPPTQTSALHSNTMQSNTAQTMQSNTAPPKQPNSTQTTQAAQPDTLRTTKKITFNKAHSLAVLSDFIKQSSISIDDNINEISTKADQDFRDSSTQTLIALMKNKLAKVVPKKDLIFARRNHMLEIWRHTENQCRDFLANDQMAGPLKKMYLIDTTQLKDNPQTVTTTEYILEEMIQNAKDQWIQQHNAILTKETLPQRTSGKTYNTQTTLLLGSALTEIIKLKKEKVRALLVCSGSQMVPGGGSNQGLECAETPLCYASSYYSTVSQISDAYPIQNNHAILIPNVLIIKDHTQNDYPMLPMDNMEKITVVNSPPSHRPEVVFTDSNQRELDQVSMDIRLFHESARFKTQEQFMEQFRGLLRMILFFNFDTFVIDDRSVEDCWMPVHHTAELMARVLAEFKGRFNKVVIAVEREHIYSIFKQYFR